MKRLVREKARLNHFRRPKLFIICIGINDIPEGLYDLSERRQEEIYYNLVHSFKKIKDYVQRINRSNRVIIAIIPPKDLRHSVEKYPNEADIEIYRITTRHHVAYEKFIYRVNEL